jgi:hypothetical protein
MKLEVAQQTVDSATTTASTLARQAALAGIATVWLFAGGFDPRRVSLSVGLTWALVLFIAALFLDLTQYIVSALMWRLFALIESRKIKERERRDATKDDYIPLAPDWINYPAWTLFGLKVASVFAGFAILGWHGAHMLQVT